jgi:Fe-S-cluster containining protein
MIQKGLDARNAKAARMAHLRGEPVQCGGGCFACCTQWVGVTYLEAEAALLEAGRVGFKIDGDKLTAQAKKAAELTDRASWFGTKCLFLDDEGLCGVYASRPIACRAVQVVTPPANCGDPNGIVSRLENRDSVRAAYGQLMVEHQASALVPVVGALPLMVKAVLDGTPTAALAKEPWALQPR